MIVECICDISPFIHKPKALTAVGKIARVVTDDRRSGMGVCSEGSIGRDDHVGTSSKRCAAGKRIVNALIKFP